jgi:hypothetical protein
MKPAYRKERILAIKKNFAIAILFALFSSLIIAQDADQMEPALSAEEKSVLIKEFSRSAEMDGLILNFVLLNNKTIDALFSGSGKYSMRARANAVTTFYVQGVPDKKISFDPRFVVEQDGKTFKGEAINMKNLETGAVQKGTRIAGLIQLGEKIDVTQPFKIKGTNNAAAEFKLSKEAIELMTN